MTNKWTLSRKTGCPFCMRHCWSYIAMNCKKKQYDELVYSFEKYRVENSYPIRYNLSV